MKLLYRILFLALVLCFQPLKAQYNPYLKKKAKNKPSAVMARQNKKEVKKQKHRAKRQMRRSRKKTGR
jgi:hypothetical protein